MQPAPIQVSYMGFPGTTGASYIDYLVTDKVCSFVLNVNSHFNALNIKSMTPDFYSLSLLCDMHIYTQRSSFISHTAILSTITNRFGFLHGLVPP